MAPVSEEEWVLGQDRWIPVDQLRWDYPSRVAARSWQVAQSSQEVPSLRAAQSSLVALLWQEVQLLQAVRLLQAAPKFKILKASPPP